MPKFGVSNHMSKKRWGWGGGGRKSKNAGFFVCYLKKNLFWISSWVVFKQFSSSAVLARYLILLICCWVNTSLDLNQYTTSSIRWFLNETLTLLQYLTPNIVTLNNIAHRIETNPSQSKVKIPFKSLRAIYMTSLNRVKEFLIFQLIPLCHSSQTKHSIGSAWAPHHCSLMIFIIIKNYQNKVPLRQVIIIIFPVFFHHFL